MRLLPNPRRLGVTVPGGRTYTGVVDTPLDNVPEGDGNVLVANGWTKLPALAGVLDSATSVSGAGIVALAAYAPGGPDPAVSGATALDILLYAPTVQQYKGAFAARQRDFYTASRRTRIARTILYVSNVAANGMPVGNDANAGTSKLLPKLTYASAFSAASNGDTIVLNGSATPYDLGASPVISKSVCLTTNVFRGATVRTDNVTTCLNIGTGGVTIGPIVIDATRTSTGLANDCIFASSSGTRLGTAFYGTKFLAGSVGYASFNHEILLYGCLLENQTTNLAPLLSLLPNSGSAARLLNCTIDGKVRVAPSIAGVSVEIDSCDINANTTTGGTQRLIEIVGASSVAVRKTHGSMAGTATWAAVEVQPHASRACTSVTIEDCTMAGAGTSATAGGYGIIVGAEAAAGVVNVGTVAISRCELSHTNHGIIVGYGVTGGYVEACIARDSVIGLIRKGEAIGSLGSVVQFRANVVIGGTLTGGALRAKETTTVEFANNTVVFDAASAAAGIAVYATGASTVALRSNIISGGGGAMPSAVLALSGCTINASGNLYHAASFGVNAWQTPLVTSSTYAGWASSDAGSVNADPQFLGAGGDYRPALAGPAAGAAVVATDFDGATHNARGAFAAAAA